MPLALKAPVKDQRDLHESITAVSPGEEDEELKDQDRANHLIYTDSTHATKQIAIVCDGITQSPNSAQAAEYVSLNLQRLYESNGIRDVAQELLCMRRDLMMSPVRIGEEFPQTIRPMLEEIIRHKRASSYQTTFISARLERTPQRGFLVSVLGCGDSAIFIFNEQGNLLYSNTRIDDENQAFDHASPVTEALPDGWDETESKILAHSQVFNCDIQLLLCSDGFYDAFSTFNELFCWLTENRQRLAHEESRAELMAQLHARLIDRKGDDDISFVWLFSKSDRCEDAAPRVSPKAERNGNGTESEAQGFVSRLFSTSSLGRSLRRFRRG